MLRRALAAVALCLGASLAVPHDGGAATTRARLHGAGSHAVVLDSLFPAPRPRGLMVTSGGWLYCANVRRLAREARYTLLCGRYAKDGYLGRDLRSRRHLDWGNPRYLAEFAAQIRSEHRRVGGELVFVGVSYSGFGVATLASHHPELRPDRLIVVDSYLDLVARRRHAASHATGREIDRETGGSRAALRARSVDVRGLATLVRHGTKLSVIWSITAEENRFFRGATCARDANAETLAQLARTLGRPVYGWVTNGVHGHDLWDNAAEILVGKNPGSRVRFGPGGKVPPGSHCP